MDISVVGCVLWEMSIGSFSWQLVYGCGIWDCWSLSEIWPFSDFEYGFKYSWSTSDLLTVVFGRIVRAFNTFGATRAVALD